MRRCMCVYVGDVPNFRDMDLSCYVAHRPDSNQVQRLQEHTDPLLNIRTQMENTSE